MRIKKIRLFNRYKRFHDLTIDLGSNPKKIIALVGPNGSGKSSVFDGMFFVSNAHGTIGNTGGKDQNFHSMDGRPINHQAIQITFDNDLDFSSSRASPPFIGKEQTLFSFRNAYRYNANLNITSIEAVPDIKLNAVGASNTVDIDDKMTENFKRLNIHMRNERIKNELTDKQVQRKVLGELNEILKNCLEITIVDEGDVQSGRGSLYFKKTGQDREFSFNVLSSGEKEVVDLLLDIFLRRKEYNDTVYIIDEPELHLNTAIQKKLLIELEKLLPENCQLWVATHSIGFLNALQTELNDVSDIIYFEGELSTMQCTLEPMVKSRANWKKVFSTALEDLTGLLSPNVIIYCEGRAEPTNDGSEQGLDAEIYNTIFSQTHPNTLFISSGGSTEPDKYAAIALKVLGKAFSGVSLCLLKDKDINPDGSVTTDEQRTAFIAQNPLANRMLKRREIENYLFDYEVIFSSFPNVTKEIYDTIIPDVQADIKSAAAALMTACQFTGRNLNRESFKRHLATNVNVDMAIFRELKEVIFS